ncbi:OsmC/Ohr family protein [hydrothermal vent metagenome]|uniref:OsmC/Ohr family protein n=1 Tax=hydrothermal vent metagenome TaxID=652676 RepID=A0A3B0UGS9_9ZZZZ
MSKESILTKHTGGMSFETQFGNHKLIIDADPEFGGENKGPKPKPLVLNALTGCTGMDVVSLLTKMRVEFKDLEINVDAEMTEEHPKYYNKIHLIYAIKAKEADRAKVEKAVNYSQERYCGVSFMLSKSAELTYEIDMKPLD